MSFNMVLRWSIVAWGTSGLLGGRRVPPVVFGLFNILMIASCSFFEKYSTDNKK